MELVLDEDHQLVAQAARELVRDRSPLKRARTGGFSRELWTTMAELGWLGLTIPEEHGGSGLGNVYAMLVLEELGRGLVPEPVLPTLAGAAAIALGSPAQRAEHLPAIAAGQRVVALALDEAGARFTWNRSTAVVQAGRLRGEKVQVVGAGAADLFVVSAAGGQMFLVPAAEASIEPQRRLDGRDAAVVRFDGAQAEPLGVEVDAVLDRAAIALGAEMLGTMSAAFEMTLAYLKSRQQFGVPIGSFQGLQHRAARLFVDLELVRAAVTSAHALLDAGAGAAAIARAASLTKAKCSEVLMQVAHEGIQMHGGIGMTEDHDIGLYLKRARVAEMTFGDAAYHRDRYARLRGF